MLGAGLDAAPGEHAGDSHRLLTGKQLVWETNEQEASRALAYSKTTTSSPGRLSDEESPVIGRKRRPWPWQTF